MIEKLKQNIEQENKLNQYSNESFPHIEQVKIEPTDVISTTDQLGMNRYYLLLLFFYFSYSYRFIGC